MIEEETGMTGLDLSGVTLPFTLGDVVQAGMDLIGVVGPFVAVGLAFVFAPKIIALVKGAMGKNKQAS